MIHYEKHFCACPSRFFCTVTVSEKTRQQKVHLDFALPPSFTNSLPLSLLLVFCYFHSLFLSFFLSFLYTIFFLLFFSFISLGHFSSLFSSIFFPYYFHQFFTLFLFFSGNFCCFVFVFLCYCHHCGVLNSSYFCFLFVFSSFREALHIFYTLFSQALLFVLVLSASSYVWLCLSACLIALWLCVISGIPFALLSILFLTCFSHFFVCCFFYCRLVLTTPSDCFWLAVLQSFCPKLWKDLFSYRLGESIPTTV